MKICVCIKQVPDTTEIKINPETNTLIRDGVPAIVNTFDQFALEAAARIKDKHPDTEITVVSMGPPNAANALKECLAIAADKAFLVSGRPFGGSDTLATSYILFNAVKKVEETLGYSFDAIFCGKQAIDGDTAQVGPEMAEHLGYPQISCALEVLDVQDGKMEILKEDQDANQVLEIHMPCLITFTKPSFDPRFPTIKRKLAANRAVIPVIDDSMLTDIDATRIGLKGSPTHVKKSFVPVRNSHVAMVDGDDALQKAKNLLDLLGTAHVI